jgi:hypothetical protein
VLWSVGPNSNANHSPLAPTAMQEEGVKQDV